jgi:hypothetical protein
LVGLLELVGQGKAAIHPFPKQFPTTSMHRIGAVMEVAPFSRGSKAGRTAGSARCHQ